MHLLAVTLSVIVIGKITACNTRVEFCQTGKRFQRVSQMLTEEQAYDLLLQQICYAAETIHSLKDCVKECTSCDTCVGFAQKKNQCYLCRTDISVGHLVNFGLLKQFYISQDYLEQGDQCYKTGGSGPHPSSCLRIWWMEAGCTMEGTYAPHQPRPDDYWNRHAVSVVQNDMSLYYGRAMARIDPYPLRCLGAQD